MSETLKEGMEKKNKTKILDVNTKSGVQALKMGFWLLSLECQSASLNASPPTWPRAAFSR